MSWIGGNAGAVAPADRFDWFADAVSRTLMPSAFTPRAAHGFHAEGALLDLGDTQMSRFAYSPLLSRRTWKLIRKGDPEQYQLGLVTQGSVRFAQHDREAELQAGDMVLWDTSRPYESTSGADGRKVEVIVLQVPKSVMPLPARRVQHVLAQRIPGAAGTGAILSGFLTSLAAQGPDCRAQDLGGLGHMAVELAATCLARHTGGTDAVPAEARSRALLRRVNAFIDANLADPGLSPGQIAEHHHISLRSLYLLFEDQPESVAAAIRRRRLERCGADLADPSLRDRSIGSIGADWGFASATAFSRAFRAAYGTTPGEHRADSLRVPQ